MEKQTDYNYFITFIVLNERGFSILHNIKKQGCEVLRQEEKERNACQMAISKCNVHLNLGNRNVASNQRGYVYLQTPNSTWELPVPAPGQSTKPLTASSRGQGRAGRAPPPPPGHPPALLRHNPGIHRPRGKHSPTVPAAAGKHRGSHARSHPASYWCQTQRRGRQPQAEDPSAATAPCDICMPQFFDSTFCFYMSWVQDFKIIRFLHIDLFSRSTFTVLLP